MPAYNAARTISMAIESVLKQNYPQWELLVINDGSNDATEEIVQSYLDPRIRLIQQRQQGVSAARNKGLQEALGSWIAFLDADDLWLSHKLQTQLAYLKKYQSLFADDPELNHLPIWFCSDYRVFVNQYDTNQPAAKVHYPPNCSTHEKLLIYNFVGTLTVFAPKLLLLAEKGFSTDFNGPEDWELWLRMTKSGNLIKIPETLSYYRLNPHGISKNAPRQIQQEWHVLRRHLFNANVSENTKSEAIWQYYRRAIILSIQNRDWQQVRHFYWILLTQIPWHKENFIEPLLWLIRKWI